MNTRTVDDPISTHWGRVTHIYVSRLTITGSDNALSPNRRQAIIWTNAGILLIQISGTTFSEILSKIPTFSFNKTHVKMSSAKRRPFCLVIPHHASHSRPMKLSVMTTTVNTMRPRQQDRHFSDDIFKCIFWNENVWILLKISPKFVPKVRINNITSIGSDNGLAPTRR